MIDVINKDSINARKELSNKQVGKDILRKFDEGTLQVQDLVKLQKESYKDGYAQGVYQTYGFEL